MQPIGRPHRRSWIARAVAAVAGILLRAPASAQADFTSARERLLAEIDDDMRATAASTGRTALSPGVRRAMATVPRERFVPPPVS